MRSERTGRRVDQVGAPERVSRVCPWHQRSRPSRCGLLLRHSSLRNRNTATASIWDDFRLLPPPYQPQRYARNSRERGKERRRVWGDISDTAPHAGLAGTPRPSAILHNLWVNKMSVAWMTGLAPCLVSGTGREFILRGLRGDFSGILRGL
jgi:hypothetical protein